MPDHSLEKDGEYHARVRTGGYSAAIHQPAPAGFFVPGGIMFGNWKWLAQLAAAAVVLVLLAGGGFWAGWSWSSASGRADLLAAEKLHSDTLGELARAGAQQLRQQQERYVELQTQLAEQDKQHHEELTNVQKDNVQLAVDLAAAKQRLSVRITGHAASASGVPAATATATAVVDDGAGTRADLHPTTAAGLVRVTGRADECRVRLTALQAWVQAVVAEMQTK
ncbi:MAG: lysis system i-spanin subunit Rz [Pseudomonas sp.]|uniref:lysis system i-spanin subunit Rz n=1 Tax=Pseudomonas sp. TaxID=306 RepID=UPI003242A216